MNKARKIIFIAMLLGLATCLHPNTAPVVTNVQAAQRDDGSLLVDIYYDVYDADGDTLTISMQVSNDNAVTWDFPCNLILPNSHIGEGILSGTGKHIVWNVGAEHPGMSGDDFVFKIIADDGVFTLPEDMVFVQGTAGITFNPGGYGYFNPGDTGADSYNVSLSDFYISKYEVTQAEYEAVMGTNPGGYNSQHGDPLDHPINYVSWFNAIEYCNRLSMLEGLTPAYSYSTYGTDPDDWPAGWNTSNANHTNVSCNWSADGYRLPTEMQREYAARGGVPAQNAGTFNTTYAGTNVAGTGQGQLGDYAWYRDNAGINLPGGSSHPDYGTHPVGTKLPNELGLYDMSGNVWNWVWDIWGSYPSGSFTDPTGPVSGVFRVFRGGSWHRAASYCTVSYLKHYYATYTYFSIGFRVCRVSP